MKHLSLKFLSCIAIPFLLGANPLMANASKYLATAPNAKVTDEAWREALPFLLPEEFEIKEKLDELFNETRAILNSSSLKLAGFTTSKPQEFSLIVVTKHPNFPGYIFKIYLDNEKQKSDNKALGYFIKRVKGSIAVQKCIDENHLDAFFKVPKKWIYPMPSYEGQVKKYSHKNFILVVEDMEILSAKANVKAWRSSMVTKELLVGLHRILTEVGLVDCAKIDNIPFSKDGRVAFVDTESFGFPKVPLHRLKEMIPSHLTSFWSKLIKAH